MTRHGARHLEIAETSERALVSFFCEEAARIDLTSQHSIRRRHENQGEEWARSISREFCVGQLPSAQFAE
jgi:hypothetical protein